jgi:hypothetical protein
MDQPGAPALDKDTALKLYREMLLIRRFEERAGQLYGMGLIGGFCHLYIGQEAIAVGMQSIARPGDQVITGYRAHGHTLMCGISAREVMAELTGRAGGVARGKGGSCTCSPPTRASTAATASSAPRCRWAPGWRSPTSTRRTGTSPSSTSATARPTRGRCTRASTWPSCGSCRPST